MATTPMTVSIADTHYIQQYPGYAKSVISQKQLYYRVAFEFQRIFQGDKWTNNLKVNMKKVLGNFSGKVAHAHHVLPRAFESWFKARGIKNINDPFYGMLIEPQRHQEMSYAYNKAWFNFKIENPYATVQQILDFAKEVSENIMRLPILIFAGEVIMRKNFYYYLYPTFVKKWFLGRAKTALDMRAIARQSMSGFKGSVIVEIVEGTVAGDILEVGLPLLVVSDKVIDIWRNFEKFETYPIIIESDVSPVKYTGVVFLGRGGPFDPVESQAVYSKAAGKIPAVIKQKGRYFDDTQWDGSDLFTIDDFPCAPVVTEKVVREMKKRKVTNCDYILLEKVGIYK